VNQETFQNKHSNEILKYSSLQHNLQEVISLHSHLKETLTYLKLVNSQMTLGNKYEMEVTGNITVNGSGSKSLMEGNNKQLYKNKNIKVSI